MVNLLKIDTHEPSLLDTLLKQVLGDVIVRTGLNDHGYADFTFNWWSGLLEEIERKQTNEILSSLEDVEYQIGEQIFRYPDSRRVLLIEGMQPTPTPMGIQTWKPGRNSKYYSMDREFKFPYQKYERWKADLERKGVLVWNTANLYGTAQALIALYRSAQEGSSILERYLRVKGIVQPKPDKVKANEEKIKKAGGKPTTWKPNPYVQQLIQSPENGLGVELAQRVIELYGTPWDLYRADPKTIADTVPGISITKARQLLKSIGRRI